jgi:hypothetical protein
MYLNRKGRRNDFLHVNAKEIIAFAGRKSAGKAERDKELQPSRLYRVSLPIQLELLIVTKYGGLFYNAREVIIS